MMRALDCATPIGNVPYDYPFMRELCSQAHIRYRDVERTVFDVVDEVVTVQDSKGATVQRTIKKKVPKKQVYRDWSATFDNSPSPRRRKTPTGRTVFDQNFLVYGTNEHNKFVAILDFIVFRGEMNLRDLNLPGKLNRENILNVAIGKETSILLPNGDRVEIGKRVEDFKRMGYGAVVTELAKMGLKKYQDITPQGGAADSLPEL